MPTPSPSRSSLQYMRFHRSLRFSHLPYPIVTSTDHATVKSLSVVLLFWEHLDQINRSQTAEKLLKHLSNLEKKIPDVKECERKWEKTDVGRDCESDRTTVWPSNILSPQPHSCISPLTNQRGNKHNLSLWKMSDVTAAFRCSSVLFCSGDPLNIQQLVAPAGFKTSPTDSHFQINIVFEKTYHVCGFDTVHLSLKPGQINLPNDMSSCPPHNCSSLSVVLTARIGMCWWKCRSVKAITMTLRVGLNKTCYGLFFLYIFLYDWGDRQTDRQRKLRLLAVCLV